MINGVDLAPSIPACAGVALNADASYCVEVE
jgi:hypothetical protein